MAIDDLLDEHEQSEKVRTWLRDNAAGLIGGVLLGFALIGGWRWWQSQQEQARVQSGERFQVALGNIQARKLDLAKPQVTALPKGAYATLAALELAKAQLEAGQRDAAIATLGAVKASEPSLGVIANQRLARLLIDAGRPGEALKLLAAETVDAEVLQVRGDAHFALGHRDEARAAYAQALTHLDVGAPQRRLVELKLSEVGGVPAKPEAKT